MDTNDPLVSLFIPRANSARGMLHAARATLGSLPMIARALLKRAKKPMRIVVDRHASTGSTDCETRITLPLVPLPKSEADVESAIDMAALLYGLIHHEVGHCNHSDIQDFRSARPGIEQTLVNVIEDVRMENAHIRELPSSRAYLDAMNMAMHKQGKWAVASDNQPPEAVFLHYVMTHLNATYRNDPMSMMVHKHDGDALETVFSLELRQNLDALLSRTDALQSSRDSLELARDVVKLIQQEKQDAEQQQAQPQPEQGQGDDSSGTGSQQSDSGSQSGDSGEDREDDDDGKDGQEESDSGADDASEQSGDRHETEDDQAGDQGQEDDAKDPGEGSNSDAGNETSDENGQDQSQSGSGAGQGGQGSNANSQSGQDAGNGQPSLADKLKQLLSSQDGTDAGDKHRMAHEVLQDIVDTVAQSLRESLDVESAIDDLDAAQQLGGRGGESGELVTGADHDLSLAHSASLTIRRKLLTELDARTNADVWVGKRGRSLSARHLDRVMTGDGRVFRNKTEGDAPDTAIMLVQDVSGSMAGYPVELAAQALYASALAMEGIEGIDVAAMAFPGNGKVLGFGESPRAHQQRFKLGAWGGTPMADAVHVATQALLGQRSARRLMIVLTDGAPNSPAQAQSMIASAEAAGIEVYGVGICTDIVQHLFQKSIEIHDINQLPTRLVSLIRDEVMLSMAA